MTPWAFIAGAVKVMCTSGQAMVAPVFVHFDRPFLLLAHDIFFQFRARPGNMSLVHVAC